MRAVFFGTPAIAVPALQALSEIATVCAVVCQPDRPAGRGLGLREPEVKLKAAELGIPVHQPIKVRTGNLDEWLRAQEADVAVVLAYGRILPLAVLEAPRKGCLNLHASLLPKYRGAAPIQWALIKGETETGISLMQMDAGLDTGPVFSRHRVSIDPQDDCSALTEKLAVLAAAVVRRDVPAAVDGRLASEPQDSAHATHAPPLSSEITRIEWSRPATELANLVRGLAPRPGAWTTANGKRLKVLCATARGGTPQAPPGTLFRVDREGILVATGEGVLRIDRAQLEGKRALDAADLVNGRALNAKTRLGTP